VIQATEAVQLARVSQTITQQLCADAPSDATTPTEGRCAELLVLHSARAASFENDRGRFRKLFEHTTAAKIPTC
jgi:hypothetical protein